ncbi:hypothetical protein [Dietzia natronolimnaea]|uniref:hypothetical protein n=1 Tax=Dietzia natronolimnaea TaxID=161920 RepID=UPI0015FBA022|nr:hypothetical protein [Dietzia natronolimnaea]MBB1036722.1 hypothetical protein [Dietzia natronolimnaea]
MTGTQPVTKSPEEGPEMQDHSNTPNAREESTQPWRTEPPADSPWYSDSYLWQSLYDESVHHVPAGAITPEMRAETDRDARPFWWSHSANAAVALVEDVERADHFRVVQADTLTKLVALLRNGVEWPDFVTVSEPLPWVEFETFRDRAFRIMCATDSAAFALKSHGFVADPMGGRWVYRLGERRARIASLLEVPDCWVAISSGGWTDPLMWKTEDEVRAEIARLVRK